MSTNFHIIMAVVVFSLSACAANPTTNPLKPSTDWVANSPEWAKEAKEVFAEATAHVEQVAVDLPRDGWGVILDLDETVLNNVEYQISRDLMGLSYTPESWFAWTQQEAATLVPGAFEFIEQVNKLGGHVAFVTNRKDTEQLATENNLKALGLKRGETFRVFLTRATPVAPSSKDDRFALVPRILAVDGFPAVAVIAYVGDGIGDKPATGDAWKFFCIDQGAMYGDPCAKVPGTGR